MLDYLKIAGILLEVLFLFNLLIVAHELGHFLAARWRGLVVEKFGIWFGKPLWKKTIGGVEYSLGSIPAGGFVALPQLAPMESLEGESKYNRSKLPPISAMDKIIVAAAGPAASLGMGFLCAVLVWFLGRPVSESEMTTVIGYVLPDSPAEKAGLLAGDNLISVDGNKVSKFSGMSNMRESVTWNIVRSEGSVIPIVYERGGQQISVAVEPVTPEREGWRRKQLRQIGIVPFSVPMVAEVMKGSPAELASIKPGDLLVEVNGERVTSTISAAGMIRGAGGNQSVNLTMRRGNSLVDVDLVPKIPKGGELPMLGVLWDGRGQTVLEYPEPWTLVLGSMRTMVDTLSAVFSPASGIKAEHLSGPIGIMRVYYMLFEAPDGWRLALWFSVVLNINLALLNLLPIPVLDGGHITLALIEKLRRKPINAKLLEFVQTACALFLVGYMLYISFYDVQDLPWGSSSDTEVSFEVE